MITYYRIKPVDGKGAITRYRRTLATNHKILFIKPERVPGEVLEKMQTFDVDQVDYDEKPELPRCLFCEGYKAHQRICNGATIALCTVHYFNKSIGQIAAELRSKGLHNGVLIEESTPRQQEEQPQAR